MLQVSVLLLLFSLHFIFLIQEVDFKKSNLKAEFIFNEDSQCPMYPSVTLIQVVPVFTFKQVNMCAGGVPVQRVEHHHQGAVLLHRLRVRRPLIVQHRGGVHPGAEAAPDLLVPSQYLVHAQHGALGPAADDRVTAGVDGAADVSRAVGEEGAAVQQQTLAAVVLQEPLQHRAVHLS